MEPTRNRWEVSMLACYLGKGIMSQEVEVEVVCYVKLGEVTES